MAKIMQKSLFELEPEEEMAQIEALELRIRAAAKEIAWLLTLRGQFVTAAESLTGGMICASLVDIPGSSNWFSDGFVTYSDSAKARRLGVDPALIAEKTAVSSQVGLAMAQGALIESGADYAVAVTGLAGPFFDENGESYPLPPEHEPGLVYIACACRYGAAVVRRIFTGTRAVIRKKTNLAALLALKKLMQSAQ